MDLPLDAGACRVITEQDVNARLKMPDVLKAVERAFAELAAGQASNAPRMRAIGQGMVVHSMSATAAYLGLSGWKQYVTTRQGAHFYVGLHDASGRLIALIEANRLGQMRTGAASGVAARHLAVADADRLGLIGCGWQAESQLEAIHCVRPLREALVFSRDPGRRAAFAQRMSEKLGLQVTAVEQAEDAVRDMPMVVTATTSGQPVLSYDWLKTDAFVAAVGSNWLTRRELDVETVARATRVVCDDVDACRGEAGDLIKAVANGQFHWQDARSLSAVVAGASQSPGQQHHGISLFKSVGLAIEDVATAALLLQA